MERNIPNQYFNYISAVLMLLHLFSCRYQSLLSVKWLTFFYILTQWPVKVILKFSTKSQVFKGQIKSIYAFWLSS